MNELALVLFGYGLGAISSVLSEKWAWDRYPWQSGSTTNRSDMGEEE